MFFLLAVLVVFIFVQALNTRRLILIGTELAHRAVPYARVNSEATFRILVIGDSTAVGTGASEGMFSMAGRLATDFPQASIVNKGVNGMKTHQLVTVLEKIKNESYDLVVIHIGGNDIVRFTNLDQLSLDIQNVLKLTSGISKNVFLVTSGDVGTSKLLPLGTRWFFSYRTRRVRNIFISATQDASAHYVDIYGGHQRTRDPYKEEPYVYYAADIFHPSDKGYENWYSFVREEFKKANLIL